jgi:hypothetical protein
LRFLGWELHLARVPLTAGQECRLIIIEPDERPRAFLDDYDLAVIGMCEYSEDSDAALG